MVIFKLELILLFFQFWYVKWLVSFFWDWVFAECTRVLRLLTLFTQFCFWICASILVLLYSIWFYLLLSLIMPGSVQQLIQTFVGCSFTIQGMRLNEVSETQFNNHYYMEKSNKVCANWIFMDFTDTKWNIVFQAQFSKHQKVSKSNVSQPLVIFFGPFSLI